MRVKCN